MGNRLELLFKPLAKELEIPLSSPFVSETIVVQSKGMQRWLDLNLAEYFSVWGNCDYPFPNKIADKICDVIIPEKSDVSAFDKEILLWKIMKVISGQSDNPDFKAVNKYLNVKSSDSGLRRFQLAGKIAEVFDQYTLFRPDILEKWERGKDKNNWQAILWRVLVTGAEGLHRGRLQAETLKLLYSGKAVRENLPERINIFGISYLPPFHMELLAAVSDYIPVAIYLLSPSREYWGDIGSKYQVPLFNSETTGNSLLTSFGKLGRDFFNIIMDFDSGSEIIDCYEEPGEASLLSIIQNDIFNLRPSHMRDQAAPENDRSVQIHLCHSPMRELEVFYDQLLSMFENNPDLTPKDIVVMIPDIEKYAPYISAVFGKSDGNRPYIPYSIADRSFKSESASGRIINSILKLAKSRFTLSEVLTVLDDPCVMASFDISEQDMEFIKKALAAAGVRWGRDRNHRETLGLPGFGEQSWEEGIKRLLMGYAVSDEGTPVFGIFPYDNMEGESPLIIGKFLDFFRLLERTAAKLNRPNSLNDWKKILDSISDDFIKPDHDNWRDLVETRKIWETLSDFQQKAGFDEELDLEIVTEWLENALSKEVKGYGFLTGGITFCALLPMRSIPFKVVAVLGLDDGLFPRSGTSQSFDLIAASPRRGDRSLRDEDRYLFLEALLSAREIFYLSYCGRSIKDNSVQPPSVVVSELLDYIDSCFPADEQGKFYSDRIITEHRLQPFSVEYFRQGGKLFSYSKENFNALLASMKKRDKEEFISSEIPLDQELTSLSLGDLMRFWSNPSRYFLRERLGLYLDDEEGMVKDIEPFALKGLEKYNVDQSLVKAILGGKSVENLKEAFQASGCFPLGEWGEALFKQRVEYAEEFCKIVEPFLSEGIIDVNIDISVGGINLVGQVAAVRGRGALRYRAAEIKSKDYLSGWIEHLALSVAMPGSVASSSLIGRNGEKNKEVLFAHITNPGKILTELVNIYKQGIIRNIKFFPETSQEYSKKALDDKKSKNAINDAQKKWYGSEWHKGEASDPYVKRIYDDEEPLDKEFQDLALRVWGPILASIA